MAMHTRDGHVIRTTHEFPPIPIRSWDWSAIFDDTYCGCPDCHCPVGTGPTEEAAIADLLENYEP